MTTLLLVRHGETNANASGVWQGSTDTALNARGLAQAEAVAEQLAIAHPTIDIVYSSPLGRAAKTAGAIAERLGGIDLTTDANLQEFNLGEWEGLTYDVLENDKRLWAKMSENPFFAPPGGESAVAFATRLVTSLQTIVARHPGQLVVVVGHGGALATALAMIIDQDGSKWPNYQMSNCGISELRFDPEPHLLRLNDTDHLQKVGVMEKW